MSQATSGNLPIDTQQGDDVNVKAIAMWGFISVVFTAVSIMGLYALYFWYVADQREVKSYQTKYEMAEGELNDQKATLLGSIAWSDKEAGVAKLPIDEAMKLVVEQYKHEE